MGAAAALNWVLNAAVGLGFPLMQAALGPLAFAPFCAVLAFWLWLTPRAKTGRHASRHGRRQHSNWLLRSCQGLAFPRPDCGLLRRRGIFGDAQPPALVFITGSRGATFPRR